MEVVWLCQHSLMESPDSVFLRLCLRSDTHLESGDIVHFLLGGRAHKASLGDEEDGVIVIDDNQGQVVVNPDLLLSGTAIVSGVYCLRRFVVYMFLS